MSGTILNRYNSDDVYFRSIIIGLLNLMNDKLTIWNRIDENTYEDVNIPFFYSMAGDERFMQDIFIQQSINDCIEYKVSGGNITQIPAGVIKLTQIGIDTARMTNRFVRGEYIKMEDGELNTYNSMQNLVPLTLTFEVEMRADSQLDLFKMVESLIKTFYKTFRFSVMFKGSVVGCQVGFPEEFTHEKAYEWTFDNGDTTPKITFNIELETYYPIIDTTQEFKKSQKITDWSINITDEIFSNNSPTVVTDSTLKIPSDANKIINF